MTMYKTSNFRPNQKAELVKNIGYDSSGSPVYSSPKKIGISVIKIESGIQQSSIRADKSGTKNRGEENIRTGRVLISPRENFDVGDRLIFADMKWKIDSKMPSYDQAGMLHHYMVDLKSWA